MSRCIIWNPTQEAWFWQKQNNRCYWPPSFITDFFLLPGSAVPHWN